MTTIAIACLALVAVAASHYANQRRPVAERLVDLLYQIAAWAYAVAQAADAALVRYRSARHEIRCAHIPMYAEVRQ